MMVLTNACTRIAHAALAVYQRPKANCALELRAVHCTVCVVMVIANPEALHAFNGMDNVV
jgi:hypothetical protein